MDINKYLEEALNLATQTYKNWNYPIWALLIVNGEIAITWENKVVTEKNHSYHAEIDIINKSWIYRWKNNKKIIFVTLEPCNNCAKALVEFWIDEVYYILEDPSWWGKNILNLAWIKTTQIKYKYEEYLDLLIDFMQKHWWYNEALAQYISIKNNWENLYQKHLDKIINDNFINISKDFPNYNTRKIVYNNTINYLKSALLRTPEDKHQIVFDWYIADTNRIIKYCVDNFVKKDFKNLEIDFIKNLHKNLFPTWFIQKARDINGNEFVQMIPWEYRKINLYSKTNPNQNIYLDFSKIEVWFEKIVWDFNNSKFELWDILLFMANFSRVHPFWDGNGRTIDILTDLLLEKNWFSPYNFWALKLNDEIWFYKVLDQVYETKDTKYMYEFIEKINFENLKKTIR